MSNYFNTCPKCGSNLDPGERCDCEKSKREKEDKLYADSAETEYRVIEKSFYKETV